MLLSLANSKTHFPSFHLPMGKSCPGKTKHCKEYCYAKRGHFCYTKVKLAHENNLSLSKKKEFPVLLYHELSMLKIQGHNRVRIHPSGDFYSQAYFDKWLSVIRKFPSVVFTAYTRSYFLKMPKDMPKNFILYYSMDGTTKKIPSWAFRFAYVVPKKEVSSFQFNHIPTFVCKSKCYKCKACYLPKNKMSVIFKKH